jgi:peptide deformylase
MESPEGRDQSTDASEQEIEGEASREEDVLLSPDAGVELEVLQLGRPGYKALRNDNIDVEKVTDHIKMLANSLVMTMYAEPGVGLAAPQIGANVNIVVMDAQYEPGGENERRPLILINPKIIDSSGVVVEGVESCLSVPGIQVPVQRDREVTVAYMDLNEEAQCLIVEDFEARVIQHELDHLNGTLIIDYLSKLRYDMYIRGVFKGMRKAKKIMKKRERYESVIRASERRTRRATGRKLQPELPESTPDTGPPSSDLRAGDGCGDAEGCEPTQP